MTRIGVLSDTHGFLDPRILEFFEKVDQIWHAGDIGSISIADELKEYKPLVAVHGNIDDHIVRMQYKAIEYFTVEETNILLMHIGGYPGHYDRQCREFIEQARPHLFVCGHSHILRIIYDKKFQMLSLNPGAAGKSGFHQVQTCIRFAIDGKDPREMEILELKRT
ncbi:MAG: metallophosphoesterase family protein [Bacteroidales bacterium]